MTSLQHTYYVADADDVKAAIRKRIGIALNAEPPMPVSFFAVAPLQYTQEKHLYGVIKRVLAGSNSRHSTDLIIREADNYCFYVALGAEMGYVMNETERLQQECDNIAMRVVNAATCLPRGSIDEQAAEIYNLLNAGIEDQRRKRPVEYQVSG